jgi:hypothetical protein
MTTPHPEQPAEGPDDPATTEPSEESDDTEQDADPAG